MKIGLAFSKRLENILKERKITLNYYCKKHGIARSTLVNLQRGEVKNPSITIVYIVARALDMSVIEFLNDELLLDDNVEFDK